MKGSTERCVTSWILNIAMKDKVSIGDKDLCQKDVEEDEVMLELSVVILSWFMYFDLMYHYAFC